MSYEDDQDEIVESAREIMALEAEVAELTPLKTECESLVIQRNDLEAEVRTLREVVRGLETQLKSAEVELAAFRQAMFDAGKLTGGLEKRIARAMAVPLALSASKSFRLPYNKGIQAVQAQLKDDS